MPGLLIIFTLAKRTVTFKKVTDQSLIFNLFFLILISAKRLLTCSQAYSLGAKRNGAGQSQAQPLCAFKHNNRRVQVLFHI